MHVDSDLQENILAARLPELSIIKCSIDGIITETWQPNVSQILPYNTLQVLNSVSVVCWLIVFYGISTFVGYLTPNPFYANSSI